ncbi:conjugal transfer protein TraF [Piscirickettsia salmonis]|uniref:conjugal transfer protein TraF n=1 Tax=Piscirickettsia salmonis TaxID=1238 RepID=UPI0006BD0E79|nr:conjugal transfer protein TraF [Piscirickettsia salmonis]ALA26649.1 conjugative transfer protein TrbB [Piscirickettsia salmonis]APS45862.1 hypothetical protein AVI48_15630 [Piscirickettsia salmonis]APS49255.1 hypothetical protein AVI49_16495 [Piscirickettsia salmonis]QGO82358.1 conjugal transfer protein TrbB [Piscirickettsia salmonis]QGP24187.1 conjugal transfer protein TrbB [Piscirickettsia salmonis]
MKKLLIIATLFLTHLSFANVAADQINTLLAHKTIVAPTHKKEPKLIQDLQKDYYFVLFYRSTCPHCHKFAPILKDFSKYYGLKIVAYSTDGGDLDGLHGKRMNAEEYRQYFLKGGYKPIVPALYLQNKYTDQVYPVLFGEATPYQLSERINGLMAHIEEQAHV